MPKEFKTFFDDYGYPCPMPSNAGDWGGTKGGAEAGTDAQKETGDALGAKVTTVDVTGGPGKGAKIDMGTHAGVIATPSVRTQRTPLKK